MPQYVSGPGSKIMPVLPLHKLLIRNRIRMIEMECACAGCSAICIKMSDIVPPSPVLSEQHQKDTEAYRFGITVCAIINFKMWP